MASVESDPQQSESMDVSNLPEAKEMKSIVLTGFGGVGKLKVYKSPQPLPVEGEILIKVKACGLNFADLMVRQGVLDNVPKTPMVMGFECAGVVEMIGENVVGFEVGKSVIAITNYGAWAEYVAVPAKWCFSMPDGMSFEEAAAISFSYITAYTLLFDIANLTCGKSVLVHSAGGGVGTAVAQLCKTVDNVILFGTASKTKHESLQDKFSCLIDRYTSDYVNDVRVASPEGVDIVLDCLSGDDVNKNFSLVKPMGKYILYGAANQITGETRSYFSFAKSVDKMSPLRLYDESKSMCGYNMMNLLFNEGHDSIIRKTMRSVLTLFTEGKIRPIVDSTYAFEEIGEAMQKMHDHKNIGKILLIADLHPRCPVEVTTPTAPDPSATE